MGGGLQIADCRFEIWDFGIVDFADGPSARARRRDGAAVAGVLASSFMRIVSVPISPTRPRTWPTSRRSRGRCSSPYPSPSSGARCASTASWACRHASGTGVPVLVALAQRILHHARGDDERAAGVGVLAAHEPDEGHEVRPRVALEQRCRRPVLFHAPLGGIAAAARGLHGDADILRTFRCEEIYGGSIHHPATVDVADDPSTDQQSRLDYVLAC